MRADRDGLDLSARSDGVGFGQNQLDAFGHRSDHTVVHDSLGCLAKVVAGLSIESGAHTGAALNFDVSGSLGYGFADSGSFTSEVVHAPDSPTRRGETP